MFNSPGTTSAVVQVLIATYLILLFADEDLGLSPAPRPLDSSAHNGHLPSVHRLFVSGAHVHGAEQTASQHLNYLRFENNHQQQALDTNNRSASTLSELESGPQYGHDQNNDLHHQNKSNAPPASLAQAERRDKYKPPRSQASDGPEAARFSGRDNHQLIGTGSARPAPRDTDLDTQNSGTLTHLQGTKLNGLRQRQQQQQQQQHQQEHPVRSANSPASGAGGDVSPPAVRQRRLALADELNPDCEFQGSRKPAIFGLRCDDSEVTEDGTIIIKAFSPTRIYVIGRNLYSNLTVALTEQDGAVQDDCTHLDRIKSLRLYNISMNIGEIVVELPPPEKSVPYYFCVREDTPDSRWYHQGSAAWLRIAVQQDFMPLWAKIITIAVLLSMSGLFSGLNLGLMALDKNELQVIMKCGTEDEKRYATAIEPVRRRGNYLLCSILFSNTLVNSTISVFLEDLSSGMVAIVMSTVLIVLFGEILPQAFCSRHGLAVGARTIWLTHFCMFITFPLSYPVSYCLDWALGEEIGHAYDRERLMEFIQVTRDVNNLGADEVNIIAGALKIKRTKVSEVMTKIEDVYMIDEEAVLDFETIQAIAAKGYSRIPVHELGNKHEIKAVLFAKDLALVDPDDKTPVQTMTSFYNHPVYHVDDDKTLDFLLSYFKKGESHMAFVRGFVDNTELDPFKGVIGVITLEDVIEEIMQMEINDETDILSDNKWKKRRKDAQVRRDFSQFTNLGTGDSSFNVVTPQLCLAAYQYLATTVEPFTKQHLTDSILRRLLSQKIFYKVRVEDDISMRRLYTAGEPADYFIMILEGRVHVTCGKENLVFDGGPFSFFGKAALTQAEHAGGDSLSVVTSAATQATTGLMATTPGATTSGAARKDSSRPTLSRRESLAKIMASQLSLSGKKQPLMAADQEQLDLSPTSFAARQEAIELTERGVYCFKPDYTVEIIANTSYLKVTRNDYITALKASQMEKREAARAQEGGDGGEGSNVGGGGSDVETTFIFDNLTPADFSNHDQMDGNNP